MEQRLRLLQQIHYLNSFMLKLTGYYKHLLTVDLEDLILIVVQTATQLVVIQYHLGMFQQLVV